MKITIIKPGLLSTVQDMGRYRYLSQAVPVSGAMDELAHRLANKAVGNDDHCATIEFTYADASFKAETSILISYSGDGAFLVYHGELMPAEKPLFISAGSVIKLISNPIGVRTYLAVAGGWNVHDVMESKSTYLTAGFGGYKGRALQKADVLVSGPNLNEISNKILKQLVERSLIYPNWCISRNSLLPVKKREIRVVPANEICWFDATSILSFLTNAYTVNLKSNRMGYQLTGKPLVRKVTEELLSTAVTPGTIQVTGSGDLVMLMADCQTTGGYPRIAQVAAVDLPLCAQLKPGDTIEFAEVSRDEAEELYLEREHDLLLITRAINLKYTQI